MKLIAILLTAAFLQVSARGITQTVNLKLKDATIEQFLEAIQKQTGYAYVFVAQAPRNKFRITLSLQNASLKEALDIGLKGSSFTYSIAEKLIIIKKESETREVIATSNSPRNDSVVTVKGKITNSKGDPLPGVSVTIKGTSLTVVSDKDGTYYMPGVGINRSLMITSVGYEMQEMPVRNRKDFNVQLIAKATTLEEVEVKLNTGYQQVSKERFVGAVSTLNNAALNSRPGIDILSRLDGMVSGVLFDKKSPTSTQLQNIQIRGLSTLSGLSPYGASTAPLVIVDNFPFKQDLSSINPNDIESINVLKDAAATSVWGSQAGNGVIVITTKKGKFNQPFHISVTSNVSMQTKPDLYRYPQMKISDFIDMEMLLFNKGFYDPNLYNTSTWPVVSPVVEMLQKRRMEQITADDSAAQMNAFKTMDTRRDLNKWVYRRGMVQQHFININGGNNIFYYTFSGGYNRTLNNLKTSSPDEQYTVNTNAGIKLMKNLDFSTNIMYSQTIQRSKSFSLPAIIYPYAQLADQEGNFLAVPNLLRVGYTDTAGAGQLLDWKYRPLQELALADQKINTQFVQLATSLAYKITSWLTVRGNYQYNRQTTNGSNYQDIQSYYTRNLINTFTNLSQTIPSLRNPIPIGSILDYTTGELTGQNMRVQADVNKVFANRHSLTAMIAAERSENKQSGNSSSYYGYNNETGSYKNSLDYQSSYPIYNSTNNQFLPNKNSLAGIVTRRFVSLVGNISYSYNDRYTVYASARRDGANVFGVNANRRWKPLWSVGGSWDISREEFYAIKWMPRLRLRASYGFSGNPTIASGLPIINYNVNSNQLTNLQTADIDAPPNPDLRWEKVGMVNVGVEFSMLNGRITGGVDFFHKKSTDIFGRVPVAPSSGVVSYSANVADMKGNGFEISLNSKNIEGPFTWVTGINFSHAKTIITKVNLNKYSTADFISYSLNPAPGMLAYGLSSYRWAGLDPITGDPQGYVGKSVSKAYNAILTDSLKNQVFNGSAIPLYFGNIGNVFTYKGFSLSVNITYRFDFYYRKPTISYNNLASLWVGNADYASRWKNSGDEKNTTVPSFIYPILQSRDEFYQNSEVNIRRGDNIRLSDVGLSYNWKSKLEKSPVKNWQLFLSANQLNAIIWKKDKSGYDPDFIGGNTLIYPPSKYLTARLMITF